MTALSGCATRKATEASEPTRETVTEDGATTGSIGEKALQHPGVQAVMQNIEIAEASEDTARAGLFPTLFVEANAATKPDSAGSAGTDDYAKAGLAANYSIKGAVTSLAALRGVKAQVRLAGAEVFARRDAAILEVVSAVADEKRAGQMLRARRSDIDRLQTFLKRQRVRESSGIVSRTDILKIKGRIAESQTELAEASGNFDAASATKLRLVGPADFILADEAAIMKLLPPDARGVIGLALAANPRVGKAEAQVEVSETEVSAAETELLPDVDVYARTDYNNAVTSSSHSEEVGIRLSMPLFDGLRDFSRIRAGKSRLRQSSFALAEVVQTVEIETQRLWNETQGSQKAIKHAKERVAAAKRVVAGVREGARIGARSTEDELSAYEELANAESDLAQRNYDLTLKLHQLLGQTGQLISLYK